MPVPTTLTRTPARRAGYLPGRVALAGFLAFWVAVVVGAALNPGYSHTGEFISALASEVSSEPMIMMAGIIALAIGTAAAGVGLARRLRGGWGWTAGALLALSGALGVVAGVAQQDCSTALAACQAREIAGGMSGHHVLHELTALGAFVLALLALFPLAGAFGRKPRWSAYRWPTLATAMLGVALLAWLVVGDPGPVAGLVQRAFVLLVFGIPVLLVTRGR